MIDGVNTEASRPVELMNAMQVGRVCSGRRSGGRVQNMVKPHQAPIAHSTSPRNRISGAIALPTRIQPTAATTNAAIVCQTRSRVRSELPPQTSSTRIAMVGGIADMKATSEIEYLLITSLTINGTQVAFVLIVVINPK